MTKARLLFVSLAAAPLIAIACSDGAASSQPCTDIPEGGCPLSHGVACDDPTCEAVYACNANNTWSLDHACPPHDASTGFDANVADASDASLFDANIDAPPGAFGGPGCEDLEPPDCELGLVLDCPSGCCGCEDLFVCNNGGWDPWGTCSLDGGIQQSK
ncbi:MAG TPA: hypothetical protein VIF62_09420 [Labilithrix sp.]|jgi:hypothetical protein